MQTHKQKIDLSLAFFKVLTTNKRGIIGCRCRKEAATEISNWTDNELVNFLKFAILCQSSCRKGLYVLTFQICQPSCYTLHATWSHQSNNFTQLHTHSLEVWTLCRDKSKKQCVKQNKKKLHPVRKSSWLVIALLRTVLTFYKSIFHSFLAIK